VEHDRDVINETRHDGVVDAEVALVLNVTLNDDQLAVKVTVLRPRRHEQLPTHRHRHMDSYRTVPPDLPFNERANTRGNHYKNIIAKSYFLL